MDDLISRAEAVKAICGDCVWYNTASCEGEEWECDSVNKLRSLPSAEAEDRPQGEWIRTGRTNIYGGIEVQCSNCNDKVMVQHLEDEWYCRHCGADMGMKGADDEF